MDKQHSRGICTFQYHPNFGSRRPLAQFVFVYRSGIIYGSETTAGPGPAMMHSTIKLMKIGDYISPPG